MTSYPKIVHTEECMRDGLQIESADIPVADKIRLLEALSETGLREIAVGSFVSPKWTPQMAQIDQVVKGFTPRPGVRYTYTALNERGMERARAFTPPLSPPVNEHSTRVDLCDVFVQRNNNRTQDQQVAGWQNVIESAVAAGVTCGGIALASNAFGSNWTGEFTLEQRMNWLDRMHQLWDAAGIPVTRVYFADAMSWNMPHQVEAQLVAVKERWPAIDDFNLHLHNGRGTALASIYAALKVLDGTDTLRLQTSIGGMAGCPYWRQRSRRLDDCHRRSHAHARGNGDRDRRRSLSSDRGGLARRGDRRPSALRFCLQGRPQAAIRSALPDGHATHRNA